MEVSDEIRELILIGASALELRKKAIEPYIVPVDDEERTAYQRLRVARTAEAA